MGGLYVVAGGAIGASLRYGISLIPYKGSFPLLTLITNILGAIVIGYIAGTAAQRKVSPNLILFLKTGVCGGFTTFSTFSLEAYSLFEKGRQGTACVYTALSILLCIVGVGLGMYAANRMAR